MSKQHSPSAADEATKRQVKVADDALIGVFIDPGKKATLRMQLIEPAEVL